MKQRAIKTVKEGVTAPIGYTVFQVKTVFLKDDDQDDALGQDETVHYEVCDDTDGRPLASASTPKEAVDKAESILKFLQRHKELEEEFEKKPDALKSEASPNVVKRSGIRKKI
ncbi:hypothetical protein [Burkholderia gladioli]|uniref:hypothetical protein n=1 Tax=Burkholderia gladioli TaxID=28095 RepID=UPI002FE08458